MYNCIALYGQPNFSVNLEEWFKLIISWFANKERCIEKIGVVGAGFSGKAMILKDAKQKIEKNGFEKIRSIEIYSTPKGKKQTVFDWKITSDINLDEGVVLFCYEDSLFSIEMIFDEIVAKILNLAKLDYGIFYQRSANKGPACYAYGMTSGLGYSENEMKEADRIAKWMHLSVNERSKCLRDVYRINLLSEVHLSMKVKDNQSKNLHEWIQENDRGILKKYNERFWIWRIDESKLDEIREYLGLKGLLQCFP